MKNPHKFINLHVWHAWLAVNWYIYIYNELSCVFKLVVELNSELKFVSKYYGSYYLRKTVETDNFI